MERLPRHVAEIMHFHWVDGPKIRGTLGIFNLCLGTLIICIWSALHPDMPLKRYSASRRIFCSIFWMAFALHAPELVLMNALGQRMNASTLAEEAIVHLPSRLPPQPAMLTRLYNYFFLRESLIDVRAHPYSMAS